MASLVEIFNKLSEKCPVINSKYNRDYCQTGSSSSAAKSGICLFVAVTDFANKPDR